MKQKKQTIQRFLSAIGVSLMAFFELCLTGRAVGAWRIARADPAGRDANSAVHPRLCNYPISGADDISPPFAPTYLSRLVIVIAIAVLIIAGALFSVERPDGHSFFAEDGIQGIDENQMASGTGTEPPSSGSEQIAIIGCVVLSFAMIVGSIILNELQKPEENNQ